MTDSNPSDGTRIDRRTLLAASGASLAGGLLAGQASGRPGRTPSNVVDESDRQPDVRVVDNSSSDAAVVVKTQYVGDDGPTGTAQRVAVRTKGMNHPSQRAIEPAERTAEAVKSIDKLDAPVRGLYEVEASHRGASDTTRFNIGDDGGALEETVEVRVRPDGSVSADTATICRF